MKSGGDDASDVALRKQTGFKQEHTNTRSRKPTLGATLRRITRVCPNTSLNVRIWHERPNVTRKGVLTLIINWY